MKKGIFALSTIALMVTQASTASAASFDWKAEKGSKITVMLSAHPMSDSLTARETEFEKLTGIDVVFEVLPESDYRIKLNAELASKSDSVDVFMTGPSSNWEYSNGGWIENLQPFIDNAKLTGKEWAFSDFYQGAINTNRWSGEEFAGVGTGPLYAIPMTMENYLLHYRADVLEKHGIAVPDTVDELIAAAKKLDGVEHNGNTLDGFVARGTEFWPILITGYGSVLFAYGVKDIEADGTSGADSKASIEATTAWSELMQYTPDGIASFDWNTALNHYMGGNAVFFLDADVMAPTIRDAEKSSVANVAAFAPPPSGPAGRASGVWLWALGMNTSSDDKNAAWYFIQWASSKAGMETLVKDGVINPTRASVANGDAMKAVASEWPGYLEAQKINGEIAGWHWNPSTRFSEAGNRWAEAVQEIYLGGATPKEALGDAARDIDAIIQSTRKK